MRIRDYEKEIARAEAELIRLKAEKEKVDAMPTEHRLADMLHARTCHHNHTDACGYEYESWSSPGHSKKRELERIQNMLNITDAKTLEKIILHI